MHISTKYLRKNKAKLMQSYIKNIEQNITICSAAENYIKYPKIYLTSNYVIKNRHIFNMQGFKKIYSLNNYKIINIDIHSTTYVSSIIKKAKEIVAISSIAEKFIQISQNSSWTILEDRIIPNFKTIDYAIKQNLEITFVDINLHICPINEDFGPYIEWTTKYFIEYCKNNLLNTAEIVNNDVAKLHRIYSKYYRFYKRHYGVYWYAKEKYFKYKLIIFEAIEESKQEINFCNFKIFLHDKIKYKLWNNTFNKKLYNKIIKITWR